MKVVVTGIGLVSALGTSLETSWRYLLSSKSSIQLCQPFPELEPRPLALINSSPADLTTLVQSVVSAALRDASLVSPIPDCGVVIGSSRSHQPSWEQLAQQMFYTKELVATENQFLTKAQEEPFSVPLLMGVDQEIWCHPGHLEEQRAVFEDFANDSDGKVLPLTSPHSWLETLPHMAAITAARQIGSVGPVLAPMAACATGVWAVAQGFELIQTGQCQRVIAGAVEAPITPLTLAGFKQMGALAQTGAYPFDQYREGLVLGEGAAVFVLESAELAKQRSAKVYGEVLGFGLTADGYHVCATEPENRAAVTAVKQCLERSRLSSADIDYIHAHGTATQLNDQSEAQLIRQLFPQGVPVSSTKGATGHTLGASGALGIAFCLMALKHQILPPCVGLKQPEFDLDLITVPCQGDIQKVLCFSFGFGGQNAVIGLGKI